MAPEALIDNYKTNQLSVAILWASAASPIRPLSLSLRVIKDQLQSNYSVTK
jgi:hypothetical protein